MIGGVMTRKNWDKIARQEFEAMDPEEREHFMELRAKIYGE